jgi:hypothetical protein
MAQILGLTSKFNFQIHLLEQNCNKSLNVAWKHQESFFSSCDKNNKWEED